MQSPLSEILNAFVVTIQQRGSLQTAQNYHVYLKKFFNTVGIHTVEELTAEHAIQFMSRLQQTRTNRAQLMQNTTINYHLIALRSFIRYCHQQGMTPLTENAIRLLPITPHKRPPITDQALSQLREAPLTASNAEIIQFRDKTLLELILTTGLKVSEIASLKRADVQTGKTVITIRGLRGSVRSLQLTEQTHYWLERYMNLRTDIADALFVRHDKAKKSTPKALTARSIQRIIKRYVLSSNLGRDITPESLRQQYAKHLAAHGVSIHEIKQRLGHASSATTKRYTQ